jgi:beta-N-acetylhexosaminidase
MPKTSPQIGQHLFIGLAGTELTLASRRLLNTVQPGGIVLFARNCESEIQLREFCGAIQNECSFRPLIAIDQENGRVNRLRQILGELPTIAQLKRSGTTGPVEEFARQMGQSLHRLRIDVNFAPVLDLELFEEQPVNALQERCWGRSADEVIRWAGAFLNAMEAEGVAACPKHFPGLGGATIDSHEQLPTIARSSAQILGEDVRPYQTWIEKLSMIMVSHGHYPALDGPKPLPASLSRNVMTRLLRKELGYRGLILTDDMEMGAITQFGSVGAAAVEAFCAGADMLLVCHTAEKVLAAHESLTKAAEQGKIPARRLQESAERIAQFHAKWIERKAESA